MLPIIGPLIDLVSTGVEAYAEHKKVKQQGAIELERKKLERLQQQDISEDEWNKIQAQNSKDSWKDEFYVILLSIPAILSFIPGYDIYVKAGFSALADTPDWYKAAFLTAVAASFGVKQLAKWKIK